MAHALQEYDEHFEIPYTHPLDSSISKFGGLLPPELAWKGLTAIGVTLS